MVMLVLLGAILCSQIPVLLGFGDTVTFTEEVRVNATQLPHVNPQVQKFDVFVRGGVDFLNLSFLIPVSHTNDTPADFADFWIIDLARYSPSDNPIEQNTLLVNKTSNCSNLDRDTSLSELFLSNPGAGAAGGVEQTNLREPFFQQSFVMDKAGVVEEGGATGTIWSRLSYTGPLSIFSQCRRPGGGDVWVERQTERGVEYTVTLYANNIATKAHQDPDTALTTYHTSYFSTTYVLKWRVSQYIVVNTLVSSIKRIQAELVYASVQPHWDDGRVTGETAVFLAIRTVLAGGYKESVMMGYIQDSAWFDGLLHGGKITSETRGQPPAGYRDTPCEYSYTSNQDCQQTWHFNFLVEDDLSGQDTINGMFFFELQFLTCDSLEGENFRCISPFAEHAAVNEVVSAEVRLDTVVEVLDEKENTLGLQVSSISSADGSAEFLASKATYRGIYHKEKVVILINPEHNYEAITQHGIRLTAFLVCFNSEVRTSMGCLDVAPQFRYIAFLEKSVDISINGKKYTRADFETPKQTLEFAQWDPAQQTYEIRFTNLALSGESRVYKITMLFRLDVGGEEGTEGSPLDIQERSYGVEANATPIIVTTAPLPAQIEELTDEDGDVVPTTESPSPIKETTEDGDVVPTTEAASPIKETTEDGDVVVATTEAPSPIKETEPPAKKSEEGESKDGDKSEEGETKDGDKSEEGESKDGDKSEEGESKDGDTSEEGESKDGDKSEEGESKDGDKSEESKDGENESVIDTETENIDKTTKEDSGTSTTIPVQPCERGHRFVDMETECIPTNTRRGGSSRATDPALLLILLSLLQLLHHVV